LPRSRSKKRSGRKLGRVLVELGFVSRRPDLRAMARQLNIPFVNLKFFNIRRTSSRGCPKRRRAASAPSCSRSARQVPGGMADPTDLFAFDEVTRILKREIQTAVVNDGLLMQTIDRVYRRTRKISGLAKNSSATWATTSTLARLVPSWCGGAPVVKLLQSVFEDAAQVNASDVHIEPQEATVHIRFRIDGELLPQTETDVKTGPAIVLRLKADGGLDIRKAPAQDGRFAIRVRDLPIDVRMSTMPTQYGESVVLRLLNQKSGLLGLDNIGMPPAMLARSGSSSGVLTR